MAATDTTAPETLGLRPIGEFDGVHDVWPRGARLEAIRSAAARYAGRFAGQGEILGVRTFPIAAAPYPTTFAFHGAARTPAPYVSIVNRMLVVRYEDFAGERRTLVWEPTVPEGSAEAPFYAQLIERSERNAVMGLAKRLFNRDFHTLDSALKAAGIRGEDVDYVSFDHLHVQDVRMVLPAFPRARLLVQRSEVGTFEAIHPMQWAWYVDGGMEGVPDERLVLLDGDVELGHGVSLVWTPGHTDGNHSLLLNTPDGAWVSSENGVAADNWQPELSKIPGVRAYHEFYRREIVPNANTLEDSLDQYDSMVKEKALAGRARSDPRWLQILPSSELATWRRQWPVVPTHVHGGVHCGSLT